MRIRVWVTVLGLVLIASIAAVVIHHHEQNAPDVADQGTLSRSEYARAVTIARSEIAKDHAKVTQAVAYVVAGKVQQRNLAGQCNSGHFLVVELVGRFPNIVFGTGFSGPGGSPEGPDRWVVVKADATTGEECQTGVSLGHFKTASVAANLLPAL